MKDLRLWLVQNYGMLLAVGVFAGMFTLVAPAADKPATKSRKTGPSQQASKQALSKFNSLIGGWRGVGMPRRGSSKGAWSETADWVWDFSDGKVALRYDTKKSKLLTESRLTYDPAKKMYHLTAKFADGAERNYSGRLTETKLVLESQPDKNGDLSRLTVTLLNPKRTLVLHERRPSRQKFYVRVAEVGYTRAGTSLAIAGANEPQCVVTGGKGTTRVSYQGKTYYVCCSGCKQAFDDDPAGIIAEYKKRLAERKKSFK